MKFHNYIFINSNKNIFDLSRKNSLEFKAEFMQRIKEEKKVKVSSYSMLGLKTNIQILLWMQSDSLVDLQNFLNSLMHCKYGKYIEISHTLFGMARPTQYSSGSTTHLDTNPKGARFLVIYPFSKTKEWYKLDFEKRKKLMGGHISVGRNFPQISQLLLYSYGIDDNEFIVSYETDDLSDFQKLVMDLRSDKVRDYTLKDTPIFTCVKRPLSETLDFL